MKTLGPRRGRLLAAAVVTSAACVAVLGVNGIGSPASASASAAPGRPAAAAAAAGVWGPVHSLTAAAAFGGDPEPSALTCDGPGDCVAAGDEFNGSLDQVPPGSVVAERHGVWGEATPIPGLALLAQGYFAVDFQVDSVSCGSPGNCALGGYYVQGGDDPHTLAFLATEKNGLWSDATHVPGLESLDKAGRSALMSLSCTAPGDCTAGGYYTIALVGGPAWEQDGFVIDERNGRWGRAVPVPGLRVTTDDIAQVLAVSCTSPGNCAAAGTTNNLNGAGTYNEAFVVQEKHGSWQQARLIPGLTEISLLSCPAAGDCAAAGEAGPVSCSLADGDACPAAYLTQKDGTWGTPRTVLTARQSRTLGSSIDSLSCGSAGNCVAVGSTGTYYEVSAHDNNEQTLLVEERHGTWSGPRQVSGVAALNSDNAAVVTTVSCPAAGDCDAGGYYTTRSGEQLGFVTAETGGGWGRAQRIGFGGVGVISCFSPGSCAALVAATTQIVSFTDGNYEGVMEKEPVQATRTGLSLSVARVTYGHEQAVRLSAAVSAALGIPPGVVLVDSGAGPVCPIGLVSGAGSCALTSRQLKPGTYHLVAYYLRTVGFQGSASATRTLTVVK